MDLRTTRDKIVIEGLKLFSQKGYEATSVGDIAKAVGIKAPSLYNHFQNKKEIFDAILEYSKVGFEDNMKFLNSNKSEIKSLDVSFFTVEYQVDMMRKVFKYTLHNEFTSSFRSLMIIEGKNHPELMREFNKRYVDSHIDTFEAIIGKMIKEGICIDDNPRTLALQFIAPISLLLEECFREPNKEDEFISLIEDHIILFNKLIRR